MSAKEWVLPLLLGGLAAGGVWFWPEPAEPEPHAATVDDCTPTPGVTWVFEDGPVAFYFQGNGSVLALVEGAQTEASWCQAPEPGLPDGAVHNITLERQGPFGLAPITEGRVQCIRAPCPQPVAPWIPVDPQGGARFDPNGTLRVELYVFDATGRLLASDAQAATLDRFRLSGDFVPLSDLWWYVGDGAPPEGSTPLPFGADAAREALAGQPVGAIATLHLEDHPYAWLVGPVWLTARITALG